MGTFQQPAAGTRPPQGTEAIDCDDELLEQWLARPRHSKPRPASSWPPRRAGDEAPAPIGDPTADEWFR